MARRRVTYLEVADWRPGTGGGRTWVGLDGSTEPSGARPDPTGGPRGRRWPLAGVVVVVLLGWTVWSGGSLEDAPIPPEPAAPDGGAAVHIAAGPVEIDTRSVAAEPWGGVFEHHPDARGDGVARVHVASLSTPSALPGRSANALLVIDATHRAFGGPDAGWAESTDVRVLGLTIGDGLRTMQWDAGGYGIALTTIGLTMSDQRRLAAAVRLPAGPSLLHGQAPDLDPEVLDELGLVLRDLQSGPASAFGSPLIGQSGGASIEGQLHRVGSSTLLISVVEDQLVDAGRIRRALGPVAVVDVSGLARITAAAVLAHPGVPDVDRRVRGWTRLVLDHANGVTVELSSDVLRVDGLLDAAASIDLDRLARTAAPLP